MSLFGRHIKNRWKNVAYISAGDEATTVLISECLARQGIKVEIFGSVYHCVRVPEEKVEIARRLLVAEPLLRGRWIHYGELQWDRGQA